MKKRLFLIFLIFVSLVSVASADSWAEINELHRYPGQVAEGGRTVLVMQIVDGAIADEEKSIYIPEGTSDLEYLYEGDSHNLEYIEGSEGYFIADIEEATKEDRKVKIRDAGRDEVETIELFPEELEQTVTEDREHRFRLDDPGAEDNLENNDGISSDGIRHKQGGATSVTGGANVEIDIPGLGPNYEDGEDDEFTITGWINPEEDADEGTIWGKTYLDEDSNNKTGFRMIQDGDSLKFEVYSNEDEEGGENTVEISNDNIIRNKWNFVAASISKEEDEITIKLTANSEYGPVSHFKDAFSPYTVKDNFNLDYDSKEQTSQLGTDKGYIEFLEAISEDFDEEDESDVNYVGKLDEFRFYSRELEDEELRNLIRSGTDSFYNSEITEYKEYFHENYEEIADMSGEYVFEGSLTSRDPDIQTGAGDWDTFTYDKNSIDGLSGGTYEFEVPSRDETFYVVQLSSSDHQANYQQNIVYETGGTAVPVEVERSVEGEITHFDHVGTGCNDEVNSCEKGSEVIFWIEETLYQADEVDVTITARNDETDEIKELELLDERGVYREDNRWRGEFLIPEYFNKNEVEVEAELIKEHSSHETSKTLDINPASIELEHFPHRPDPGETKDILIRTIKPYSGEEYPIENLTEINIDFGDLKDDITFEEEDIEEHAVIDDNSLSYEVTVPGTADPGEHSFTVEIEDMSGSTYEESSTFDVRDVEVVESDIRVNHVDYELGVFDETTYNLEKTLEEPRNLKGEIRLANYGDLKGDVEVSFSGDIEDIAGTDKDVYTVENSPPGQERKLQSSGDGIQLELNFSEKEPDRVYEGEIVLDVDDAKEDVEYTETINTVHTIETPCQFEEENLCIETGEIDKEISSVGETIPIDISNQGEEDLNIEYGAEVTDDLFPIIESGEHTLGGNEEDTINIGLDSDLDAQDSGEYEGNITFEFNETSLNLPTKIDLTIPEGELEFSLDETDLGDMIEGETEDVGYQVENTGDVSFSSVDISSDPEGITDSTGSISTGEEESGELTVDTSLLSTGDHDIEFEAISNTSASDTETLSINIIEDLEDRFDEVQDSIDDYDDQIMDLPPGADTGSLFDELEDIEDTLDEARDLWDDGNYGEAEDRYEQIDFSNLETMIEEEEDAADDNGNGDTNGNGNDIDVNGDDNGGSGLLALFIPLVLLVIIGVVVYLSIVPEEQ